MEKEGYKYTFTEALEKCMFENYFIRGKKFNKGYYIKLIDDTLYLVNAYCFPNYTKSMFITKNIMIQKYKVFSVANKTALDLD